MSDRETEGEQGKEMQPNGYAAFLSKTEMQFVAVGLDSVAHRHKLGKEWETLYSMAMLLLDLYFYALTAVIYIFMRCTGTHHDVLSAIRSQWESFRV